MDVIRTKIKCYDDLMMEMADIEVDFIIKKKTILRKILTFFLNVSPLLTFYNN